jgi:hypothetical protein
VESERAAAAADQNRPRPGPANWILAGLVAAFGVGVFVLAVAGGRTDSALLFVGLPTVLAVAIVLMPGHGLHGRVFAMSTVGLLLAAVLMHEGVVCLILAAPLVYLVAHGAVAAIVWLARSSRRYALLPVPLLLFVAAEGVEDGWRLAPDQSTEVVRVVALPADAVVAHLRAGPVPAPVRSLPLRLLGVPTPGHVHGGGLDPGDRWTFVYHQTSHGPGGRLVAEVRARAPGHIAFAFVEDTSITARWFTWHQADLTWHAVDAGHTEVRIAVRFERGLDPSWYFGPLQDALMHEGLAHLLDMMALT